MGNVGDCLALVGVEFGGCWVVLRRGEGSTNGRVEADVTGYRVLQFTKESSRKLDRRNRKKEAAYSGA